MRSELNITEKIDRKRVFVGIATALGLLIMLSSYPAYAQRPDPRNKTRISDCRHEAPPGKALLQRRVDSGILTHGYMAERLLTQIANTSALKGGDIIICAEYGR